MSDREKLLETANELGLEFPKNIKTAKLQEMVDAELDGPPPVKETAPPSPAAKSDAEVVEDTIQAGKDARTQQRMTERMARRKRIMQMREKAFKTRVVTITNKDSRENEHMTTAYLSFENQYFGLSKIVPLDIPIELEQALIHIAETVQITLHRDEIINGKRTGNKVPMRVRKYAISYADQSIS